MKKSCVFLWVLFFALQTGLVFAGIEWQTKSVFKSGEKETNYILSHLYAQGGNVREEFVEMGKKSDPNRKEGGYWIYKSGTNMVIVVDPEEKTYMEVDMDKILQMGGAIAKLMKITITNPSVEVSKIGSEVLGKYKCDHYLIKTSYDIETKVAFIKSKNHVEEIKEIWATNDIPSMELAGGFKNKSFKTGMEDIDRLIEKEMQAQRDMGFVLKSITTQKNTDKKGKVETNITETNVIDITFKNISDELFKVPAGYKKIDFTSPEE